MLFIINDATEEETSIANRSSNQPLGGTSGDWRHRFLRFHVPLALASAVVLVLFMSLPFFDANVYPHADIFSSVFPQQREQGKDGPMGHGGGQSERTQHGGGQGGDKAVPRDHGGQISNSGLTPGLDEIRPRSFTRQFTVATGYIATGLLAFTLLIGPANLLLRRRNPVSSSLRRDAGIWTAIFSVVHVIYGLQLHGSGSGPLSNYLSYFVAPDGSPLTNSFGMGNWTGLAATVIVVGLLALSSNFALRKLKTKTWKDLQRLNYTLFVLVIAHAFFYGAVLRTDSPYTLLLLLSIIAVLVGQMVGVWLWRQRYYRTAARLV